MKHGARNQLTGTVTAITRGGVMCLVKVKTKAGPMASVMTTDSLDDLRLRVGERVHIIVKAVNVLLAK